MSGATFVLKIEGSGGVFRLRCQRGGRMTFELTGGDLSLRKMEVTPDQLGDLRDFISFLRDVEPWEAEDDE